MMERKVLSSKKKWILRDGRFQIAPVVKVEDPDEVIVISDSEDEEDHDKVSQVSDWGQESIVLSCDEHAEGEEGPGASSEGVPPESSQNPDTEEVFDSDYEDQFWIRKDKVKEMEFLFDSDDDQWILAIDDNGQSQVIRNPEFCSPKKRKRTQSVDLMDVLQQAPAKKPRKERSDKDKVRGKQTKVRSKNSKVRSDKGQKRTKSRSDKGKSRGKNSKKTIRKTKNFFITIKKSRNPCTKMNNKYKVFQRLRSVDWMQSAVLAQEWGLDKIGTPHYHKYIETKEKMKLLKVKAMIKQLIKKVANVQACRNIDKTIKYITKEDKYPVVMNVDLDKLHIHWKQNNTVELNEFLHIDNYHYNCIPVNYRKDTINKHHAYWSAENSTRDQEIA